MTCLGVIYWVTFSVLRDLVIPTFSHIGNTSGVDFNNDTINDKKLLKNGDESYCHAAPICTLDDDNWEPCEKSNKNNGSRKEDVVVKTIKVCTFDKKKKIFEEECVDPFYDLPTVSTEEGDIIETGIACGSCSNWIV